MDPHEHFFGNLFGVRKSVRYHQRRRAFFEWIHTATVALEVVAGSSAVATVVGDHTKLGISFAATAALLAALDLVVGTTRRATSHALLGQRFAQLERDMLPFEGDDGPGAEVERGFRRRRKEIEETEPPKLRVIDLLCQNEVAEGSHEYSHVPLYPVRGAKRIAGHVFDLEVDGELAEPQPQRNALGPDGGQLEISSSAA